MSATLPFLSLEISATNTGSRCLNPDARYGLARWTATGVTADAAGFFMGQPNSGTSTMTYDPILVSEGQWVGTTYAPTVANSSGGGGFRQVSSFVDFYNGATLLTSVEVRRILWQPGSGPVISGGSTVNQGAAQAPASTTNARVRHTSTGGSSAASVWLRRIAIRVAGNRVDAGRGLSAETWTPIVAKALSIETETGVDVEGVDETIAADSLIVTITDPTLDGATSTALRRGTAIRLRRAGGSSDPIWTGTIETADTDYEKDGRTLIDVVATGSGRTLNDAAAPILTGATFTEQGASACAAAGLGLQDFAGAFAAASTALLARDDSANAATWLKRLVATHGAAIYIDANGAPRYLTAGQLAITRTPALTFTDVPGQAGVRYTGLKLAYGSRALVNALNVRKINLAEVDPSGVVYGPYVAVDSELDYGRVSADVEIVDGVPSTIAQRLLGAYATPRRFPTELTVDTLDNLASILALYPYRAVRVVRNGLFDEVVRVASISHKITATGWKTTLKFKPLETSTTVELQVPTAGSETGPRDVVMVDFPQLAHRTRSAATQALPNNTTTVVAFDGQVAGEGIPYDSATRTFTIVRDGRYHLSASSGISPNATGARVLDLRVNGTARFRSRIVGWASTDNIVAAGGSMRLKAGDTIDVALLQNSGAALTIVNQAASTFITIAHLGA
ncbi:MULTISPECIES: hypothetical protein [unclassified Aeromicrobium]|uniref:hypothetical protein n=1 Tax=unclassified Aeromicrobium TaxID=2633570 RepID=UPI00288B3EE6|nr:MULTISPECIES: hypothetical protein [unclassified Aeromicrobium]